MKNKPLRVDDLIADDVKIATRNDKQLIKEWEAHKLLMKQQGIILTFKPVKFYTSLELTELDRRHFTLSEPPTMEEINERKD